MQASGHVGDVTLVEVVFINLSTKGEWFRKGICTGTQDVINTEGSTYHLSCTCLFFRKKRKYTP